jgi:hypothetical protein
MVALLTELQAAERAIVAANVRSSARGGRTVAGAEAAYFKDKERIQQYPPPSILAGLQLPHPTEPRRLLWPVEGA